VARLLAGCAARTSGIERALAGGKRERTNRFLLNGQQVATKPFVVTSR
jgi:hypothetical protein